MKKQSGASPKTDTAGLPRKGIFLLITLSLFWGLAWPAMKISVSEIPPWTFRSYCIVMSGIGILLLAKVNGFKLKMPLHELKPLCFVALFSITGWHLFSAHGLLRMDASRAVIIAFTMPLWANILSALLLKERITSTRILALGLGLSALGILIRPELEAVGAAPLGAVFMFGAAVSWATGTVLIKRTDWNTPTTVLTGWQLLLGGIPVVMGAAFFEPSGISLNVSARAIFALTYIIFFPMIYCHWAYFTLVRIFPASIASIGTLAIPVVGVFSSTLILNESVGISEIVALFLVVTALSIAIFFQKPG
ncbi:Permease of the drug/metabolite transporter (DMT) superfamily [Olavius sp. associated proteobacterium Delta 1]|nr:Permease of the drug/metabolite transporter (DMT) superfamily [Olavius sp. associated proteobacterium Delta 1]